MAAAWMRMDLMELLCFSIDLLDNDEAETVMLSSK